MIQSRTGAAGPATGLDCARVLVVTLPNACSSVTVILASSAQAATVTAHDAFGAITDIATMLLAGQLAPETLNLQGPGITKIVIDAPALETLLLQLCCN